MFDTTCSFSKKFDPTGLTPSNETLSLDRVGLIFWEEHCVECGQPECFKTCRLFERSFDGKCRRFVSGIVPVKGIGYGMTFKQWGKLEGWYTGREWDLGTIGFLAVVDRVFSAFVRAVNRLMAFIPGRIGAITVYRRLKLWADRYLLGDKSCKMHGLVMRVWSDKNVQMHVTVIDGEREIFNAVIGLGRGWNTRVLDLPAIRRGTRILLFSTSEEMYTLVFNALELARSGNGVRLSGACEKVGSSQVGLRVSGSALVAAKFVKCVAWDLDNTLWKGILVEDGADNLVLNETAVHVIKELDKRGIVHTVISKNDHDPAWTMLEKFGLAEYFIFPFINWMPKSGNLQSAAKVINVNLNTFAFVDDSAFERGEVGEKCPQVRIFRETDIASFLTLPEFNPPISAESANRRASYQKEMKRVAAAAVFDGNYQEFLKSCRIELEYFDLKLATEAEYERCYELIQRSNQLTLTGNRYTPEAFKTLVLGLGIKAWGIRCHDKFGDYGIIGCVIVEEEGSGRWRVKEFVMSCRVAKKGCERRAIEWVRSQTALQGGTSLVADIVDTGRNGALKEAFGQIKPIFGS